MTLGSASNLCKAQSDKPIQGKEFVENQPFKGFFNNKEFDIFMQVDLYSNGITVPDHELYGELPGYLAKQHNNFCWLITKAKVKSIAINPNSIELYLIFFIYISLLNFCSFYLYLNYSD